MPPYARVPALVGLAFALLAALPGGQPPVARLASAPPRAPTSAAAPDVSFRSSRTYETVATPVRLRIPALRVDGRVDRIGLRPDGTIGVPTRTDVAGWYEQGPRPGQPGPAVILGHVDSRNGPGIFLDLIRARPGTMVRVDRTDGSSVTFRITEVSRVPKVRFPTDLVYAPTLDSTLRLITCGGGFDRTRGSYRDNVIAYAERV